VYNFTELVHIIGLSGSVAAVRPAFVVVKIYYISVKILVYSAIFFELQ